MTNNTNVVRTLWVKNHEKKMLYQFCFVLHFVIIVKSVLVPTIYFSTKYLQKWPTVIEITVIEITVWPGMGNMN